MNAERVCIIDTGVANIASVEAAFVRLGCAVERTCDAARVRGAGRVVLPGVGAFAAGMERLRSGGLAGALRARVEAGAATLAICLGLQLLFEESEESPGVEGLGVCPGMVRRFRGEVRVPQFGWNRVEASDEGVVRSGHAYFANSFCVTRAPAGWRSAWSVHGERFVAAMERGAVVACQCHPELSGSWGMDLLARWIAGCSEGEPC